MPGAAMPPKAGNDIPEEVQPMVDEMLKEIEAATQAAGRNGIIETLEVVGHCTQVVAGINHFLSAKVNGQEEHVFVRIYDRFGDKSVSAVQLNKTAQDVVGHFE